MNQIADKVVTQGTKTLGSVLERLVAPTVDAMGQDLLAKYEQSRNARKVAKRAAERLSSRPPGAIPARLAAEVFEKAQWAEDEFVAEYLSGVLASGHTPDGGNDAAISWTALVGRMSSDQLALHWFIYEGLRARAAHDSENDFWTLIQRQAVVEYVSLYEALGWELSDEASQRVIAAAYGLQREGLLSNLSHGGGDYFEETVVWTKGYEFEPAMGYLTFAGTPDGSGLYLHALGQGRSWFAEMFSEEAGAVAKEMHSLPVPPRTKFVHDYPHPA